MEFAYVGFTQIANVRSFLFDRTLPQLRASDPRKLSRIAVVADLAAFLQCRVPIQEGPQISLQILVQALADQPSQCEMAASFPIGLEQVSAFATSRAQEAAERMARRKYKPPVKAAASGALPSRI